ncbi:hypothetical protein N9L18_00580 [Candidatus Pacebacteria bacterium]|nr:hypothetical protein [Candidatus Paceibacterota bacterium]
MKKTLPFILIILAVVIFFLFIEPQNEEIKRLSKDKEDNDTMLQLAEELQRKRDNIHDAFNQISVEERKELEKLLPDTVDNVRLILDINNVAEQYGIVIRDITVNRDGEVDSRRSQNVVSSVDSTGDIGTITLGFSIDATYDVFINFMKDLEEALRIVDIRALDIASGGEDVFLNFGIIIDTYWLR